MRTVVRAGITLGGFAGGEELSAAQQGVLRTVIARILEVLPEHVTIVKQTPARRRRLGTGLNVEFEPVAVPRNT